MRDRILAGLFVGVCLSACSGNTGSTSTQPSSTIPSTPIQAASLIVPANAAFGSPDCDQKRSVDVALGLTGLVVSNCHVTGTLQNVGPGCAGNIHGSTSIVETGGSSDWTVSLSVVRPNEIVSYTGGPVSLPVGTYHYQTQPVWTNVSCP